MSSGPSSLVPSYASASLYVGDLSSDVTEALLFEIFNAVGPVASVRVCRDAATRRSLGYAYVNFHRVEDAERALDTMNFKNIRNRPCRIMWSHRDPSLRRSGVGNIFVKHLSKTIANKQLYDTFSTFGNILSCKVATDSKRQSLGYGFVHYESGADAQNAISRVDGKVIAGQKVSVSAFKSKEQRPDNRSRFTNVYVKNLPKEFNKQRLEGLFGRFGEITSSLCAVDDDGLSRGFGFVNYQSPEQAAEAVGALNGFQLDESPEAKPLVCCRAQRKDEREKELRERFEQLKLERQKKYAGVNLYVKNLHDEISDEKLREEFAKFGAITSSKVMRDRSSEKSKGFGFVCFSLPDEATKAITEMNGAMLMGKPLYVALAQRKAVRRAQLEAQYAARMKLGVPQPQMYPQGGPLYYPGGMAPMRNFVYPPPHAVRGFARGASAPDPNMVVSMVQARGGGYQLLPVNGRPPMGGRGAGGGRGRKGGQPSEHDGVVWGPEQGGGPGFKYTDSARNRDQRPSQAEPAAEIHDESLHRTLKELAAAPEDQQKQMIGERLFPLIKRQQPDLAGKITGMLLEMDPSELIYLLESQKALNEKIQEALQVLQDHNATAAE